MTSIHQAAEGRNAPGGVELDGRLPPFAQSETIRAELIGNDQCEANGIAVRESAPVLALCRRLIAAGYNSRARLEAWRGETLALCVRSIGEGARLRVASNGVGFEKAPDRTGSEQ